MRWVNENGQTFEYSYRKIRRKKKKRKNRRIREKNAEGASLECPEVDGLTNGVKKASLYNKFV